MALPGPFSRGTFIFDLADPAQERQLIQLLRNRHVLRAAFNRIWDVVSKQGCEGSRVCRSVILEAEYVDRDYAEGYGQLYGRAFRHFERLCYRLHFFSTSMQPQDFHIPSVSSAEGQQARQKLQNCYLGFAVIRPSCPDTVGRTVILPPKSPTQNCFALCRCEYSLNLGGLRLTGNGVPFMEQDGMVGACASAAMWMAHMSVYKDKGLPTYSTTEITRLADLGFPSPSRVFPSEGLTVDQVGAGLKRMGHETFVRDLSQTPIDILKRWLYVHVESQIPTILATEDEGVGHAVVLVGHDLGTPNLDKPAYKFASGEKVYSSQSWVSEVLIHDDQRGPYLKASIVASKNSVTTTTLKYIPSNLNGQGKKDAELNILAAIVLLPPHVNCDGLRAEGKTVRLLHWLRQRGMLNCGKKDLVVRTFLLPSNEFKERLDTSRSIIESLILNYRFLHLPKYVWITEWTTLDLWPNSQNQKLIYGEVLIDPTSNPRNLDFLALHIPGMFYSMNPEERDAGMPRRQPTDIPNDTPYAPVTRAAS